MKQTPKVHPTLGRIATLGGLLGIKTSPVLARLTDLVAGEPGPLLATIPHRFDSLSITCDVPRDVARTIAGAWIDELPGDQLALEIGATTVVAHSDEAALPADAPELVRALGDELLLVGWDGEAWTYVLGQDNAGEATEATVERIDRVAAALGVTEAQRRIAGRLHHSLARGMASRAWVRARGGELDPIVVVAWDQVEWLPIQHMMSGFYPSLDTETKLGRLSRALDVDHATVELVLGPADPPGMRLIVPIESALG